MGNKDPIGRRRFVRAATGTLGLGTIASVAAADQRGQTGSDGPEGPLELEDGQLRAVTSGGRNKLRSNNAQNLPNDAHQVDLKQGVDRLNELQQQGFVRFYEQEERVMVAFTEKAKSQYTNARSSSQSDSSSLRTQGCGKTKYKMKTPELLNPWFRHKFFLDNEDTQEAVTNTQGSVALIVVIGGYFSLPTGGAAGAIATILAGAGGVTAWAVERANEGCGVLIKIKHLPVPPGTPLDAITHRLKIKSQ